MAMLYYHIALIMLAIFGDRDGKISMLASILYWLISEWWRRRHVFWHTAAFDSTLHCSSTNNAK